MARQFWLGLACAGLACGCGGGGGAGSPDAAVDTNSAAGCPQPPPSSTPGQCPQWQCDPVLGLWLMTDAPCDDGQICDVSTCSDTTCFWRSSLDCSDGNPCTPDSCDPQKGCVHGAPTAAGCDDGVGCTLDTCDAGTGCVHTIVPSICDDGDKCTTDTCVYGSGCANAPTCDDSTVCTTDACEPSTGACTFTPVAGPCDDGSACTSSDICGGGKCAGTPISCDDGDACTTDTCLPATGCSHSPPCDDGNACTIDTCEPATSQCSFTPISCDDGIACTIDSCDKTAGCQHAGADTTCVGAILAAAFSSTPATAGILAPVSPTPTAAPVFAPTSPSVACLQADPAVPVPVDVTTWTCNPASTEPQCPYSYANFCNDGCGPDGYCHATDGVFCMMGTIAPAGICSGGACKIPGPPGIPGDVFIGQPLADSLGKPGRCEQGFVTAKEWPNGYPNEWVVSKHPRDPVDDNPCTTDSCDSCIGVTHVPAAGSCRIGSVCGRCVAGQCNAPSAAALYDFGFAGAGLDHPRGLPDGGVLVEVRSGAGYGLARLNASGGVVAQVWSKFPLRQADDSLDSGNFVATISNYGFKLPYVALAFDAASLTPLLPPLAADAGDEDMDNLPVLLPNGSVAATPVGLAIPLDLVGWAIPGGIPVMSAAARQGSHCAVVQSLEMRHQGDWVVDNGQSNPFDVSQVESSWATPIAGGAVAKTRVLGAVDPDISYSPNLISIPGTTATSTALDGIAYTPAGTIAAFGRVRPTANTYPVAAAIWLAGDVTSVLKTVLFDELPTVEGVAGWANPGVGGVILPDGGVAAQVGRAVAWTDGSGKKIGYALLPAEDAGLRLFATWDDGTIGLWDPAGTRIAKIPWSWAAMACP